MADRDALVSVLLDQALATEMVPWPCPSDYGPEDRYRLEELIGASEHSLVYRATDRRLSSDGFGATVAIKILRDESPEGGGPEGDRHEALAARRVVHPNALAIHDRGEAPDGSQYLVAEYVDGGDLGQATVPMPRRRACALVAKIAKAVQAAHAAGIVHCDIKPSNILLTSAGEPKLCDFGLARWSVDNQGQPRGNPAFMSPEQFAGDADALTAPTDIYALGALLWYLLKGKLPLGDSRAEVAAAHTASKPVPLLCLDRDLDRIVARATSIDRAHRHNSAGEFAADLDRWAARLPIDWTHPSPIRRVKLWIRRYPFWTVGILASVAASISVAGVWRYNERQDRLRQAEALVIANQEIERLKANGRRQIESLVKRNLQAPLDDIEDRALPILIWIDQIGGSPHVQQDGPVPMIRERIAILRAVVDASNPAVGNRPILENLLAKFALGHMLLVNGDAAAAAPLLRELELELLPLLDSSDPIRDAIAGMKTCEVALANLDPSRQTELVELLKAEEARLSALGKCRNTLHLIQRVIQSLAEHPG